MGIRSARPTAEEEGLLQSSPLPPFKPSKAGKFLFLAEHGYILAGGTLCFFLGAVVSLVIVWIIILICNRQITVERIGAQTKIAGVYAEFNGRSQAMKRRKWQQWNGSVGPVIFLF